MEKILIVEDTKILREEICDILTIEKYEVFEAIDGLDGFKKSVKILPDLILSDILMPYLSGYEMIEKIRTQPITENIPIIFLSALNKREDIRNGMNLGADDYLTKPISPDDLLSAIKNKLQKQNNHIQKIAKMKEEVVTSLPHELQKPLSNIILSANLLKNEIDTQARSNIFKSVDCMCESGYELLNVVEKYIYYLQLNWKNRDFVSKTHINEFHEHDIFCILNQIVFNLGQKVGRTENFILEVSGTPILINLFYFKKLMSESIQFALDVSCAGEKIYLRSKYTKTQNDLLIVIKNNLNRQKNVTSITKGNNISLLIIEEICKLLGIEFVFRKETNNGLILNFILPKRNE